MENKIIKIQKIEINGFKNENTRVSLEFSSNNISIIYGPNGSGKTTVLKILFAIFSHDSKTLRDEKVNSINLYYTKEIGHKVRKSNFIIQKKSLLREVTLLDTDYNKKKINLLTEGDEYNWDEFEKSDLYDLKSLYIGVQRGIPVQNVTIDEDDLFSYLRSPMIKRDFERQGLGIKDDSLMFISNVITTYINRKNQRYRRIKTRGNRLDFSNNHIRLESINIDDIEDQIIERYNHAKYLTSRKIQNALFDTFSLAINKDTEYKSELPKDFIEMLKNNRVRLIEALEETTNSSFTSRLISIIDNPVKSNILKNENNLLKTLLYNLMKELDQENQFISSINILIDTFNEHLSFGKKLVIGRNNLEIIVGDDHHSINNLSSGERHLLTFLAIVLIDGRERNFLIIDEPEISLNTVWQKSLLPLFSILAPNTQIIVASHSPSIASCNPNYLVEIRRM